MNTEKTKEEILNEYKVIVYKDSPDTSDVAFSNDDVKSAMQAYADQEKRKEALEFANWIQYEGHLDMTQGLLHLADPVDKLYDLYLLQNRK